MKVRKRLGDFPIGTKVEIDGEIWEIIESDEDEGVKLGLVNQYRGSSLEKWMNEILSESIKKCLYEKSDIPKPEKEVVPVGFLLSAHELETGCTVNDIDYQWWKTAKELRDSYNNKAVWTRPLEKNDLR